jgi:hypothetical protein
MDPCTGRPWSFVALRQVSKHANQSRRLLWLAAVLDGMKRRADRRHGPPDAARLGASVNAEGPDGLKDIPAPGGVPRLTPDQLASLATIVEVGPDRAKDGAVRRRRIDLERVIEERFGALALNPFHAARGEIGRGPQPRLLLQDVIGNVGALKVPAMFAPSPSSQPAIANTLPPTFQACAPPHCTTWVVRAARRRRRCIRRES